MSTGARNSSSSLQHESTGWQRASWLTDHPFHPILIGLFPLLSFYGANVGSTPPWHLWRPGAIIIAAVGALWLILAKFLKSARRAALITSVFVLFFFSFLYLENFAMHLWPALAAGKSGALTAFFAIWCGIVLGVSLLLGRMRRTEGPGTGVLNVVGIALALTSTATAYASYVGTRESVEEVATRQITSSPDAMTGGHKPDVFYLLMDGYGRNDTLKKYMNVDNSAFLNELRGRGFYVADLAHSNYSQTELSVTSTLNADYIQNVLAGIPNLPRNRRALDALADYSTVAQKFQQEGYSYTFVSTGFPFFIGASADVRSVNELPGVSIFESSLIDLTPLGMLHVTALSPVDQKRQYVASAFETLKELGQPAPRPKFVFAHILLPHPPFVFWADGRPRTPDTTTLFDGSMYMHDGGTKAAYIEGYSNQLEYADRMLLPVIDAILKQEQTKPIIIIQGDHGSRMNHDFDSMTDTDFKECMAILNAYYVPEPLKSQLYPGITPVNSFRLVLRELFGADMPNLPDKSYYATWDAPTEFTDVTKLAHEADPTTKIFEPGDAGPMKINKNPDRG